jgi:hypothetical protein
LRHETQRQHQEQLKAINRNTLVTGIGAAAVAYTVAKSSRPNVVVVDACVDAWESGRAERDARRAEREQRQQQGHFDPALEGRNMAVRVAAVGQDERVWGVPEIDHEVYSLRELDRQPSLWNLTLTNVNTGDTCLFSSDAEVARRKNGVPTAPFPKASVPDTGGRMRSFFILP